MDPATMAAFLLAMQAAGLVTSLFASNSQDKFIKLGRQLEQGQFSTNLEALRLQSSESSLDEMKQLRQNISSQIVVNAAKGNRGGSSYSGISKASNTFESDERSRRLNLLAKESELRANHVLSGLHSLESESQLGQSLTKDLFNTLPISSLLDYKSSNKKQASPYGGSEY